MSDKQWEVLVTDDPDTEEASIPIPKEALEHLGWTENDRLVFTPNPDGSFRISKMEPLDYIERIERQFDLAHTMLSDWFKTTPIELGTDAQHAAYVDALCAVGNLKHIFNDMADEARAAIKAKSK